jgi:hypothetical protein
MSIPATVPLWQMQLIERAVRSVRTTPRQKRKMREELLAHLEGIYADELTRGDEPTAIRRATQRL